MELLFYVIGEAVPVTSSIPQETVATTTKDCSNADEAQPSSAKLDDGKTYSSCCKLPKFKNTLVTAVW